MWLLSYLSHFIIHLLLAAGVVGTLAGCALSMIPFVHIYRLAIQLISAILLGIGLYLEGGVATQAAWELKVKAMEVQVANAVAKSEKVNTQIVTKVITKIQLVKDTTHANTEYITKYVAKDLDADCKLTTSSVLLHNIASQNAIPGSPGDLVGGTSDVKASELLGTVVENYGTYYQVVEKLKGWQEWYAAQKKIYNEAN